MPKYWGSWKGRIVAAIVSERARTWGEILETTGLDQEALNKALSELYDTKELEKIDGKYKICYALFKDYTEFFKSQRASEEATKPKESRQIISGFAGRKTELINWIEQWKEVKKLDFSLENEHFFLEGRHLNDLSEELICNAKDEVLIVNPFIENCSLSKTLEDARSRGTNVTVVTRPPDEKDPHLEEKQEYHSKLKEQGVTLNYSKQVHAKLIVVDNSIAIVSSMNFYSGSSGGRTWEAGLVTTQDTTVKSIVNSINKLQEKPGKRNR